MKGALNYLISRILLQRIGVMAEAEPEIRDRAVDRYHWFVQRFNQLCDDVHAIREDQRNRPQSIADPLMVQKPFFYNPFEKQETHES